MSRMVVSCLAACLVAGLIVGCSGGKSGPAEIPKEPGVVVKPGDATGMSIGTISKPADKKK